MQGDNLGSRRECAVAVVALGAAECDKVGVGLLVSHRMTGDARDWHWRR